jgi:hypothetical protein
MSIKMLNHVWEHSTQKGSYLVTMLAIADYAHDDGTRAYPSIATLAKKTRMTERNVQLVLRKLEEDGELLIQLGAGPRGCNVYSIPLTPPAMKPAEQKGEKISGGEALSPPRGEKACVEGVKEVSPNPSLDPSERQKDPGISSSFSTKKKEKDKALSPYELSAATRDAQCRSNQEGIGSLLVTLWPEERGSRQAGTVLAAGCLHAHVTAAGACNDCDAILGSAAVD